MPWVQSHSNLRTHPKLKRAARMAGCSPVEMSGHLHWLWWWALETQPDGDLSVWEAEDIADAAGWEGDAHTFVTALLECGPGDKRGFLDPDMRLHDWDEYGGKYRKRSESARNAAKARWESAENAGTEPSNATALPAHYTGHAPGNAEERRGEDKNNNMADDKTYSKRLAQTLRDKGQVINPGQNLHESFRNLLTCAYASEPEEQHHGITLGVIADFVSSAAGPKMTSEARAHTARLLKTHERLKVFDGYGQAMQWGAGIGDRYQDDPLALSKYVAAILGGKR
jgi:hypothetical protein